MRIYMRIYMYMYILLSPGYPGYTGPDVRSGYPGKFLIFLGFLGFFNTLTMFFADFYMEKSIPKFSEFYLFSMTFFFQHIFSIIFIIFYRLSPPGRALDPRGSKKKIKKKKDFFFMIFAKKFKIPS